MTSVLAVGCIMSRPNSQCLMPAAAQIGYCSSLDWMIITGSDCCICVERHGEKNAFSRTTWQRSSNQDSSIWSQDR